MMTKTTAVIAAGSLAIGLAFGAASTTVGRDDAASDMADHMQGMTSMMGAGSMADMTSMMGAGSPMGPGASMSPGVHRSHHASPSPAATR